MCCGKYFDECEEQDKWICFGMLLLSIINLIILIVFEILFLFHYEKYDFENNLLFYEIENNLNGKLIYSLRESKICDIDEEALVLGTWDGIKEGCFCDINIFENKCPDSLINQGCKSIPTINPINYTIFKSNYICLKKSNYKYKDLILNSKQIVSKDKNCPNNYKSCGEIDTLGRKFCVKEEEKCPITQFSLENFELEDIDYFFDIFGDVLNKENIILSVFQLNQRRPCIHPSEKYWDYHYILEKEDKRCVTELKNKIFDDRFILFENFSENKYDLYLDNNIIKNLKYLDEITENKIKNDMVYLFARNFIGFDKEELENYNYDKLIEKQNLSNYCYKIMKYYLLGVFAFIFLILIIYIAYLIKVNKVSISKFSLECDCCEEFPIEKKVIFIVILILFIIFVILFFILDCIIFDAYKKIKSILNMKKSDEYLYELLNKLIQKHSVNYTEPKLIIILFCLLPASFIAPWVLLAIAFIFIVMCLVCKKKKKKVEKLITNIN